MEYYTLIPPLRASDDVTPTVLVGKRTGKYGTFHTKNAVQYTPRFFLTSFIPFRT